jgi:hypothetical protein
MRLLHIGKRSGSFFMFERNTVDNGTSAVAVAVDIDLTDGRSLSGNRTATQRQSSQARWSHISRACHAGSTRPMRRSEEHRRRPSATQQSRSTSADQRKQQQRRQPSEPSKFCTAAVPALIQIRRRAIRFEKSRVSWSGILDRATLPVHRSRTPGTPVARLCVSGTTQAPPGHRRLQHCDQALPRSNRRATERDTM